MCIICEAGPGCGKPQHRPEMEGPGPPAIVRVRLSKEIADFEIAGGGREKGGRSPSGCRIQNAPMPPAQRAAVFNTWFLGRPEIFDCGIWAAPKTRETMHKHMGEGDIVAAKWSYLELAWGAVFWCNRCCRTNPVVLTGFDGQVWPNIGRKPAQIIIQNCR